MAATNVQAHRVYGPVSIQTSTGSNNALETLGVSLDGAEIRIQQHRRPIYNDVGGPETPVGYQDMGETATISFTLESWVEDVLRRLKARPRTALSSKAAVFGDIVPRGRIIDDPTVAAFSLFIPPSAQSSNTALWEDSWFFGSCDLQGQPEEFKVGTVQTMVRVNVVAFPYIPATLTKLPTLSGDNAFGKLYQRGANTTAPTYVPAS